MKGKILAAAAFLVLFFISAASAQTSYTPARNSAERSAILNALRTPVEKELKQKIRFEVDQLKTDGRWAFAYTLLQNTAGKTPDLSNTSYADSIEAGMFGYNVTALLKKNGKRWVVVKYIIGCTDVCQADWQTKYKVPAGIIPDYN